MKTQRVNPLAAAMQRALAPEPESAPAIPPSTAPAASAPRDSGRPAAPPREAVPAAAAAPKDLDLAAPRIDLPRDPLGDMIRSDYLAHPTTLYSFRLRLPGRTAARYVRPQRDVEEAMEERLQRCAGHDAETPLTFDDDQRRQLLDLLGTADPESVLRHISNLVTVAIEGNDGAPILGRLQFTPEQLERAGFRCVGTETLEAKLQEYCDYGINANVGLS